MKDVKNHIKDARQRHEGYSREWLKDSAVKAFLHDVSIMRDKTAEPIDRVRACKATLNKGYPLTNRGKLSA
jgi:hypothetical protein